MKPVCKSAAPSLKTQVPLLPDSQLAPTYGTVEGPSQIGIPAVCWYILVVELCERLAFYTLAGSQEFFLEHIGYSLASAGSLNATMWTLCTVLAVGASWAADVLWGRYLTILVAGFTYVAGLILAASAAWPGKENSTVYFVGVLGLLPLATAGIKANISNFGADQFDASDPETEAAQERFFSIFYCSINLGAGVAYGFFTTFASSGGLAVPKSFGYFASYAAMAACMLLVVGVFRAGRRGYHVHPLQEQSALASTSSCIFRHALGGSCKAASVCIGTWLLVATIVLSLLRALPTEAGQVMEVAAFCSAAVGTLAVVVPCLDPSWLSEPAAGPNPTELEVQQFLRLLPVLFTGTLSFGALYNSMQFWYQQQACQMDLRLFDFQLSGSFFNIADCLAIVVFTPLTLLWINPCLEQWLGRKMGTGVKFGLGMLIAGASVMTAARLEMERRDAPVLAFTSNCAPPGIGMSDVQGSWMAVPFFLMGIGEIYSQPTLLHYAYASSPASMRTLAMAASLFISGVSSALFALVVATLSPYIPNDLNGGHLEYGYYVNIAIGIVFYALFVLVLK